MTGIGFAFLRSDESSSLRRLTTCPLLAVALFCCSVAAAAQTAGNVPAEPKPVAEKAPVQKKGLHFVFDASGSMCGYLRAKDSTRTLLTIIKRATALRDDERNHKVVLIRQRAARPSPKDIAEAPPNFQALIDSPGADPKGRCGPFDGIDSNVELMFAPPATGLAARSLVLVSDMQLDEKALTSFVDRFRAWAREQGTEQAISAGIVTLAVPFSGRYYPVAESDPARRRAGYALPDHTRPLSLLWFLVGNEDIATVRELHGELGLHAATRPASLLFGLQVLPVHTDDSARWLQPLPPLRSAAQLFNKPTHQVDAPNSDRSSAILRECARVNFVGGDLVVRVDKSCRDGKPFFETVSRLDVSLPIEAKWGFTVKPGEPSASMKDNKLVLRFMRSSPPSVDIALALAPADGGLNRQALSALSLDNDACATARPGAIAASGAQDNWEKQCAEKLTGKVYRYDALVQQLAGRAKAVLSEQIGAIGMNLRVKFER